MARYSALIVAGGSGSRMQAAMPKQFLDLEDRPLLMETIERFAASPESPEIILVLPGEHTGTWFDLCEKYSFSVPHKTITGGATRAGSVVNGLRTIHPDSIVAIHDGVRPLVSPGLISRCYQAASVQGSAVPVIPVKDTLREVKDRFSFSVDRENFRQVQTPQCFRTSEIMECYLNAPLKIYTDDAGIAEACGIPVNLVEGEETNIKITTPADMLVARALLRHQRSGAASRP